MSVGRGVWVGATVSVAVGRAVNVAVGRAIGVAVARGAAVGDAGDVATAAGVLEASLAAGVTNPGKLHASAVATASDSTVKLARVLFIWSRRHLQRLLHHRRALSPHPVSPGGWH